MGGRSSFIDATHSLLHSVEAGVQLVNQGGMSVLDFDPEMTHLFEVKILAGHQALDMLNGRVYVKIDNSSPLETQAQEQDSNPGPGSLRAAGPMDCWAARLCFLGIKPLQAEAPVSSQSQNTSTSPTIVVPKEEPLKLPNEGRDGTYVNFMSLKSSQATNQEPTQERGTGLQPGT
ncbi:hypothetical protein DSO57_1024313 [Entomophthora muscae]|uniref:Uncharacterized protein n=1 Tax=Entomophthora muscae TaxID=34485 RepID=A0ACC2T2Z1_9FUNG|nr:hypothetical protein DSO57_1024313 [Entomophthora muscae]